MKNSLAYSLGVLSIIAVASLMIVTALESDNATSNNTLLNNTTLANGNASLNLSAAKDTALNATNETFEIGNIVDGNKSTLNLSTGIKPIKDAGKLGYIIQSTPHGTV